LWQFGDQPTGRAVQLILTDCQSHLAVSQETWVRNGLNLACGHYWFFFMPVRFFYMP
jgi:hypothetical protein